MLGFQQEKNFKTAEESHANYMFEWLPLALCQSEPLFGKLNVLKIDGMFKLQLFTYCYDLINTNLPAFYTSKTFICSELHAFLYTGYPK